MRTLAALLALSALANTGSSQVTLPFPMHPEVGRPDADGALHLDPALAANLAGRERVRLVGFPGSHGESLALDVARVPLSAREARLFVDGRDVGGSLDLEGDLSLWSGTVVGDPGSSVFLAFSRNGSRGWVRARGELLHLVAEPDAERGWSDARAYVVADAELEHAASAPVLCADPRPPGVAHAVGDASSLERSVALGGPTPILECRIALETDHQYYQLFGDLDAARTYALTVLGAVSDRFRGEIQTVLTSAYLGLYTTAADPWSSPDLLLAPIDLLNEFSAAWTQGMPVEADLGHFFSGAQLNGGAGWHQALCAADYCHAVTTGIDTQGTFPPVPNGPLNHDFGLMAHELGHNFGAIHTHDYCPPLDECAPPNAFGTCQTQQACTTQGTLMSYCALCPGGDLNITTFFHAQSKADMRAFAETSCLRPFEGSFSEGLGFATRGSLGEPTLETDWDVDLDALVLTSQGVVPPTTGFLIVGLFPIYLPVDTGILVPFPLVVLTFPVSSSPAVLPLFLNGIFPAGITLYLQTWFIDVGSPPTFVSGTQGVAVEVIVPEPPPAITWYPHPTNGKEYALSSEGSWYYAEGEARTYGGHLVTVTDQALEDWLRATFYDSGVAQGQLWIGVTDSFSEGSFHWTSGDPLTFTHWAPGNPTDGFGSWDVAYWNWGDVWYSAFGYFWFTGQRGLMER